MTNSMVLLGSLNRLPLELIVDCFKPLSSADLRAVSLASSALRAAASQRSVWTHLCQKDFRIRPSNPAFAKRCYQIHSDMKKGRFLTSSITFLESTVVALLGKKIHWFEKYQEADCTARSFGEFHSITSSTGYLHSKRTAGTWNGKQFATLKGENPSLIIWENKQGCLNRSQTLQVSLPDHHFIRFQWEGEQLLTLSAKKEGYFREIIFQIWKPGPEQNLELDFSMTLPYLGENLDKVMCHGEI